MVVRREFIKRSALSGIAAVVSPYAALSVLSENKIVKNKNKSQWAVGSRLIVSVSMQFEAGGQPDNAESPFPQNMKAGFKDLPAVTWYEYGYKEGIPRMLDNWDKLGIKVTS